MPDTAVARVGVGPFTVELRATPAQFLRALVGAVGSAPPPGRGRAMTFALRRTAVGRFELRHPTGRKVVGDPWSVSTLVQGILLRALAVWARRAVQVHAACCIAPAGGALLLPALSGTGKSTAALALAAAGWRCGGDDLAFWFPDTGDVCGTDLAIALKTRAPAVLARRLAGFTHHALRFRDRAGRYASRQAYHPPPSALPWRAPLRAIGFLVRVGGRPRVRPLTTGEALARLWPLRVHAGVHGAGPPPGPGALARALHGVVAAEIRTGRIADVVPAVERWLGRPGPAA